MRLANETLAQHRVQVFEEALNSQKPPKPLAQLLQAPSVVAKFKLESVEVGDVGSA